MLFYLLLLMHSFIFLLYYSFYFTFVFIVKCVVRISIFKIILLSNKCAYTWSKKYLMRKPLFCSNALLCESYCILQLHLIS